MYISGILYVSNINYIWEKKMRMKKTYSIKEETAKNIKDIAEKNNIPESYALDMIVSSFVRYISKKKKDERTGADIMKDWYGSN